MRMNNAKGRLQEMLQQRREALPTYRVQSTGPPHSPTVVCTVTVRLDGRELRERVETRGRRREAEQLAAGMMLQRLASPQTQQEPLPLSSVRSQSASPVTRVVPAVAGGRRTSLSPVPATLLTRSPPPASCTAQSEGRSPVSVLQERLQANNRRHLPMYTEEVVRSLSSSFAVRCVVCNDRRQPVLESLGEGPSKRTAKEAAARSMLMKVESGLSIDRLPPISDVVADIPDVVDHELEDDIALRLSPYSPQYHFWHSAGEVGVASKHILAVIPMCIVQVFCLAWVDDEGGGKKAYPITGHGRGREEATAKREASCNLLTSLSALLDASLGPSYTSK